MQKRTGDNIDIRVFGKQIGCFQNNRLFGEIFGNLITISQYN